MKRILFFFCLAFITGCAFTQTIGPIAASTHVTAISSNVVNNNATANTIADITGLSFPVTANTKYYFKFIIVYTSAATATGARFSINGPAVTSLIYNSQYSLTTTSHTFNTGLTAYNLPAASNVTSAATTGNIAIIEGVMQTSASGTVVCRFASEVSNSAITVLNGLSYVLYQQLN